jgi:aldose sugar dehydrogenase
MNRRSFLLSTAALVATPLTACATENSALVAVVKGLDHPWGLAFLPDGSALVTERAGRLRRITVNDKKMSDAMTGTPTVDNNGQGGLLGIAIDPSFQDNRFIYLSFAEARDGGSVTAVYRGRMNTAYSGLEDGKVIFRQNVVGSADGHYGSRLVFDRSGHLFVTTGDRQSLQDEVQKPGTHIGKILRITRDGSPAADNPNLPGWAPEVWSLGHRNVQGATLHPETGALWTVEHGARGGDEVNTPEAGKNYGWPVISYGKQYSGGKIGEGSEKSGMEQPLHYWDPSIAPSGMAVYTGDVYPAWKGSVFVGALAGTHLARLTFENGKVTSEEKLFDGFSRIRDVVQGPDGRLYLLTDEGEPDGGLYVIAAPAETTATSGG